MGFEQLRERLINEEVEKLSNDTSADQAAIQAIVPMVAGALVGRSDIGAKVAGDRLVGYGAEQDKNKRKLLDYLAKIKEGKGVSDKVIKDYTLDESGNPRLTFFSENTLLKGDTTPIGYGGVTQSKGSAVATEGGLRTQSQVQVEKPNAAPVKKIIQDDTGAYSVEQGKESGGKAILEKLKGVGGRPSYGKDQVVMIEDKYGNKVPYIVDKKTASSEAVTGALTGQQSTGQKSGVYKGPAVVAEANRLERDLEANTDYKNNRELADKAQQGIALLESRTSVADKNAGFAIARAAQGTGLITDQDLIVASGGDRSLLERYKQAFNEIKEGKYTESNRELYISMLKRLHDNAANKLNRMVGDASRALGSRFDDKEQEDIFAKATIGKRRELISVKERSQKPLQQSEKTQRYNELTKREAEIKQKLGVK